MVPFSFRRSIENRLAITIQNITTTIISGESQKRSLVLHNNEFRKDPHNLAYIFENPYFFTFSIKFYILYILFGALTTKGDALFPFFFLSDRH